MACRGGSHDDIRETGRSSGTDRQGETLVDHIVHMWCVWN